MIQTFVNAGVLPDPEPLAKVNSGDSSFVASFPVFVQAARFMAGAGAGFCGCLGSGLDGRFALDVLLSSVDLDSVLALIWLAPGFLGL